MPHDDDLAVALHWSTRQWRELREQADIDLRATHETSERIDQLRERLGGLAAEMGIEPSRSAAADGGQPGLRRSPTTPSAITWNEIRVDAERRLRERGVDTDTVSVDDLLDAEEVRRIEARFSGGFTIEANLDRYDLAAVFAAGLTAALVDFLVVRIPLDMKYLGESQAGSPLTKWMHSFDVPSDNWLATWFKVSYDKQLPEVEGMSPWYHRLITFGHDPLLGLVVGTIDIMRGGLTAISTGGNLVVASGQAAPVYNPLVAFVLQVGHLLSDGFTKLGLPAPGWGLTQLLQVGSFGAKERTLAELARFMYLKGFDSRHFLTMGTSVAAAEIVLRGYFGLRQKLDKTYREDVEHQAVAVGSKRASDHPRFQAMALGAHAVGAAANAGKIAVYGGNPLAFNYAQWLRFIHALYKWLGMRFRSPSTVLMGHARANLEALECGWPVMAPLDGGFPTLVEGEPGTRA